MTMTKVMTMNKKNDEKANVHLQGAYKVHAYAYTYAEKKASVRPPSASGQGGRDGDE